MDMFQGLSEDTYRFFWELAFHNEISYFEENRKRYEEVVKKPLLLLAAELAETALEIDPNFQTRPSAVVSRIRRDTRFAPVDAPFRDHAFLTYRYPGTRMGDSFVIYIEFMRESYGYGMGIYGDNPPFMAELRKRIIAQPDGFLSLVNAPGMRDHFVLEGVDYKRTKFPDAPKELWPWLNKRRLYYLHSSAELSKTFAPSVAQEIKDGLLLMKPLYRFIMGLD